MINIQSSLRTTLYLYKNYSIVLLLGGNGNSYTNSMQSEMCVCVYIYIHIIKTMETLMGQKKLKYATALNSARHSFAKSGVVGIADRYGVEGKMESTITSQ
jgi:hypothetical protein